MTSVADVLNAAADLLEKPGAWTQGAWSRDADGAKVVSTGSNATCWCAMGALIRIGFELSADTEAAISRLACVTGFHVGEWNDAPGRTQEEVVQALRSAAQQAASTQSGGGK